MYQTSEQLIGIGRTQLESAARLAEATLRGLERLATLQLEAAKDALAEGTTGVRALAAVKDPKQAVEVQQRFIKPNVEKAQSYALEMYAAAKYLRQEVDQVLSAQMADLNKSLVAALDQAAKSAPNGTEQAVSVLRSAVLGASAAADGVNKLSKQLAAAADANVATFMRMAGKPKKAA